MSIEDAISNGGTRVVLKADSSKNETNRTLDIHLNRDAMWTNVPTNVWAYTLGGYQVIKKWLSYREKEILGRALKPEEVAYVSEVIRRIAAILLLSPAQMLTMRRPRRARWHGRMDGPQQPEIEGIGQLTRRNSGWPIPPTPKSPP